MNRNVKLPLSLLCYIYDIIDNGRPAGVCNFTFMGPNGNYDVKGVSDDEWSDDD